MDTATGLLTILIVAVVVDAFISAMGSWVGPGLFALAFLALGCLRLLGAGGQRFWLVSGCCS